MARPAKAILTDVTGKTILTYRVKNETITLETGIKTKIIFNICDVLNHINNQRVLPEAVRKAYAIARIFDREWESKIHPETMGHT